MKKIVVSAIIVIILTVVIFGTSAFYSDSITSARNEIASGNLDLQVRETRIDPITGETVAYEGPIRVMPGVEVSKIVTVYNAGNLSAYVRIRVEKSFVLAQGVEGPVDTGLIGLELNSEYWEEKDGYYYYRQVLSAGAETQPLFTGVRFAADMDDLYERSQAVVSVVMEAVQSANNGSSAVEAAGWPSDGEEGGNA